MNAKAKDLLLACFCPMLTVVCFSAAVTSTVAWYAYTAKTAVNYHGTAISIANLLQIGIKTNVDLSEYGLTTEDGIAWASPGEGLNPDVVTYYFKETGYAYEMLTPLTSGKYKNNDDLVLTAAPSYGIPINDTPGDKSSYCVLPLAFRTYKTSGSYLSDVPVWLNEASVICKEYENLRQGVRVHFSNSSEKFIVHPSKVEKGSIALAGLQDLNVDGYYDSDMSGKEIIYGHFTGTPTYSYTPTTTDLHDINNTGQTEATTFNSRHQGLRQAIMSYEDLTFNYAEYETVQTVMPQKTTEGTLYGGKPVTTTGNDGIGYVDMTMWIEGWDHSVYDNVAGYRFILNLTFVVNSN